LVYYMRRYVMAESPYTTIKPQEGARGSGAGVREFVFLFLYKEKLNIVCVVL